MNFKLFILSIFFSLGANLLAQDKKIPLPSSLADLEGQLTVALAKWEELEAMTAG